MATFFEMMLETPINPVYAPEPEPTLDPTYFGTFTASYYSRFAFDDGFYHTFVGSGWDDYFRGDAGADTMVGNHGDDTLVGLDGNDFLQGATGNDSLYGGRDDDTLMGGQDDDFLDSGTGDDVNIGGAGNDTILGDEGADYIDGGDGVDTVDYSNSQAGVLVYLDDVDGTGHRKAYGGDANGDFIKVGTIERVIGSQYDDVMFGGAKSVHFLGLGGSDELRGSSQDDILVGGKNGAGAQGFDLLSGDYGDDTFWFQAGDSGGTTSIDLIRDFDIFGDDVLAFDVNDASNAHWKAVHHSHNGVKGALVEVTDIDANGNSYTSHEVFLFHTGLHLLGADDVLFV
ncbi:MAG: calcium-binding protein [Pseudomonadota bacterium]